MNLFQKKFIIFCKIKRKNKFSTKIVIIKNFRFKNQTSYISKMFQSSSHHSLNSTDYELKFGSLSPVSCKVLDIIAIYCILLMVVSIVSNSLLLFIFFRNKDLRSPINTMVMALTCLNLVGSCIELPIVITSHFMCR